MGQRYSRITEKDGLLEKSIFPDIVYRSASNTTHFSQINKFFTFVKFLNYFRFSIYS
jgi:uncharacterized protein YjlB